MISPMHTVAVRNPLHRCCRDLAIEWLIIRGHLRRVMRVLP
jgi:hypothetical protein